MLDPPCIVASSADVSGIKGERDGESEKKARAPQPQLTLRRAHSVAGPALLNLLATPRIP